MTSLRSRASGIASGRRNASQNVRRGVWRAFSMSWAINTGGNRHCRAISR